MQSVFRFRVTKAWSAVPPMVYHNSLWCTTYCQFQKSYYFAFSFGQCQSAPLQFTLLHAKCCLLCWALCASSVPSNERLHKTEPAGARMSRPGGNQPQISQQHAWMHFWTSLPAHGLSKRAISLHWAFHIKTMSPIICLVVCKIKHHDHLVKSIVTFVNNCPHHLMTFSEEKIRLTLGSVCTWYSVPESKCADELNYTQIRMPKAVVHSYF